MNDQTPATQGKPKPIVVFHQQLSQRLNHFVAALPSHMPAERYVRVLMTAVQMNGELLECDRKTLFSSAMKCAQDGLLPDGREAALVVYKAGGNKVVQYQPMVAGIRKKVRNSGEIADWNAHVVYAKDAFEYERGDDPFIKHKDYMPQPLIKTDPAESEADFSKRQKAHLDRGPIIAAYSIAKFKSGDISREVMSIGEIEAIRDRSSAWKAFVANKIKTTPWSSDRGEMCKKTVVKRHAKVLPMSTDMDDLLRKDDNLYAHDEAAEDAKAIVGKSLQDKLALLAGDTDGGAAGDFDGMTIDQDGVIEDGSAEDDADAAEAARIKAESDEAARKSAETSAKAREAAEARKNAPAAADRQPAQTDAGKQEASTGLALEGGSASVSKYPDEALEGDMAAAEGEQSLRDFIFRWQGRAAEMFGAAKVKEWWATAKAAEKAAQK